MSQTFVFFKLSRAKKRVEIVCLKHNVGFFDPAKGQLISKCPFGFIFGPKYQRKKLTISALEFEKWWNQQNKGTFL